MARIADTVPAPSSQLLSHSPALRFLNDDGIDDLQLVQSLLLSRSSTTPPTPSGADVMAVAARTASVLQPPASAADNSARCFAQLQSSEEGLYEYRRAVYPLLAAVQSSDTQTSALVGLLGPTTAGPLKSEAV